MWPNENEENEEHDPRPEVSYYNGEPVLVPGDAGEHVAKLCELLANAGQVTSVSKGESAAVLDDAVYAAVEAFRLDAGVEDELTRKGELKIVGPITWAALVKANS